LYSAFSSEDTEALFTAFGHISDICSYYVILNIRRTTKNFTKFTMKTMSDDDDTSVSSEVEFSLSSAS